MKHAMRFLILPAAALLIVGCSSAHKTPVAVTPSTTIAPVTTTTVATTTTTLAPATTSTSVSTTSSTDDNGSGKQGADDQAQAASDFAAAKEQWQEGATVDAADQGLNWSRAATDLTNAVAASATGTVGYATAAAELKQLASLPDAMQTPAQMAESISDVAALNTFFGTPGLYS